MLRIALVDDHRLVRESFAHLLETRPEWQVVAQYDSYTQAAKNSDSDMDVALVDISLPDKNGLKLAELWRQQHPDTRIIMVSMYDHYHYISQAIELGAVGYVSKRAAAEEILTAVERVSQGEVYLTQDVTQKLYFQKQQDSLAQLTEREMEVFLQLSLGKLPKKIAAELDLMHKTVLAHRNSIYRKLGVNNQFELIRLAFQRGILAVEEFA